MPKVTFATVPNPETDPSGFVTAVNSNLALVASFMENTAYRTGDTMAADLQMSGGRVLNGTVTEIESEPVVGWDAIVSSVEQPDEGSFRMGYARPGSWVSPTEGWGDIDDYTAGGAVFAIYGIWDDAPEGTAETFVVHIAAADETIFERIEINGETFYFADATLASAPLIPGFRWTWDTPAGLEDLEDYPIAIYAYE